MKMNIKLGQKNLHIFNNCKDKESEVSQFDLAFKLLK